MLNNNIWLSLSNVSLSINWFTSGAFCIFANSEQILIYIGISDVHNKCIRCGQHEFETDCRRRRFRRHRITVVIMLICKRSLSICIALYLRKSFAAKQIQTHKDYALVLTAHSVITVSFSLKTTHRMIRIFHANEA